MENDQVNDQSIGSVRLLQALEQVEKATRSAQRRRARRRRPHPRLEEPLQEQRHWDQVDQAEEGWADRHVPSSFELPREEMTRRAHGCPNPTVLLDRHRPFTKRLVSIPCGRWTCGSCGPKRQAEFSKRAEVGFSAVLEERAHHGDLCEEYPHEFTVTFRSKDLPGAPGSRVQMVEAKDRLDHLKRAMNEARRRQGLRPLIYLKVVEYTVRGVPHFHFIVIGNPWPPTVAHRLRDELLEENPRDRPLLKERGRYLAKFGCGFIHSWNPAKGDTARRLARYLSDYIVKTSELRLPKYCPRYSYSRNLVPSLKDWRTVRAHFPQVLDQDRPVASVGCVEGGVEVQGRYWTQEGWKPWVEHLRRKAAYLRWCDIQHEAGKDFCAGHDPPECSLSCVAQMN